MSKIKIWKTLTIAFFLTIGTLLFLSPASAQKRERDKAMVNLDFQDADIKDVVKSISEITGKNFIMDDRVRGKVTIISPTPVDLNEAYQAFLSALEIKNYTVVPGSGRTYKVIPLREAKQSAITTISDMDTPYGDTFITRLIPIRFISATEIVNTLKTLVSPNGTITAYSPTNTLIVTDSASNIRRLMKIISKLDKEGSVEGVEIIPLKYASAPEITQKLLSLFPERKDGSLLTRALRSRRGEMEPAEAQSISKIIPDDRTNSIIIVANRQGLARILDIVKRLDIEVKTQEGKGRIHVHYLEHADAEELAATLSSLSSGGTRPPTRRDTAAAGAPGTPPSRPAGSQAATLQIFKEEIRIAPDISTNSLVITASGQDYEALKSVISKLDIPRPQVFVEALILEVNITKGMNVGASGHGAGQKGDTTAFGGTQFPPLQSILMGTNPAAAASMQGMIMGFQGKEIEIGEFKLPIFGALFNAYQTDGIFNILSTPTIMTTDNKEAEIVVGSKVPFVTAQQQSTVTSTASLVNQITREDVATRLKLTPQINESDYVTLDIYQEISEIDQTADKTLGPTTFIRSAKTTVVVQNEQTVVIGGLIKDRASKSVSKVPILGDIPLLGLLFRNRSDIVEKINLTIFITPHIIHRAMDIQKITIDQNIKRRKFNKHHKVEDHPGIKGYGIDKSVDFNSVKPGKKSPSIKATPAPQRRYENTPSYEEDDDTDATQVEQPESGTISRTPAKRSKSNFTEVNMGRERTSRSNEDSFFKEDSVKDDYDDSDFIADELYYKATDPKPVKKKKRVNTGTENPFGEVTPPSSE